MSDKRREKADLLLEIHENSEAIKENVRDIDSFRSKLRNWEVFLENPDDNKFNSLIDDYPNKEDCVGLLTRRRELLNAKSVLERKRTEMGWDESRGLV